MGVEDVVRFIESKCKRANFPQDQHKVILKLLENPARYGLPLPIHQYFECVELRVENGRLLTEVDAILVSEHHISGIEVKKTYHKFSKTKACWQLDKFNEFIVNQFGIHPLLYIAHGKPSTDCLRVISYQPIKF
jgi:hypothetical protein